MGEFQHFWPKNDGEKWSRKNIFEMPPCARNFLLNEFTSQKGGVLIKSANKMTWCAHGGTFKKKSCGISTYHDK